MAACNQTDIPVLNIQEDPCIQGSLITSCIFYGLAIDYLGAQISSSFFDVLGLIVAKLEAGNIDATNLEEDNRAQALLIEALQNSIAESLVTLSEVQVLLDECCPEPTTTTSTTTVTPTTTTTTTTIPTSTTTTTIAGTTTTTSGGVNSFSVTWVPMDQFWVLGGCELPRITVYSSSNQITNNTRLFRNSNLTDELQDGDLYVQVLPFGEINNIRSGLYVQGSGLYALNGITTCNAPTTTTTTIAPITSYSFTVAASSTSDRNYSCSNPFTSGQQTLWASTYIPGDVQKFYTDSNLTNSYIGNVNDYYAYMIGWPSGILYTGQMGADGTIFNKSTCQQATTTTTTAAPTTTTTTTVAVPGSYIFGTTGMSPWDIVLDAQGNAYTSNVNSKNVSKITPDGTSTILGTTGEIPRGITIDTQGNIYVINSWDNNVTKITPSGVSTILGSSGTGANDIAVDQQGNVYVNNSGPNTVTKITPQGVSTTFAGVAAGPQCITIDSQGNVYTASPNVVNKITPDGVSTILGNTLYQPLDIIVDDLGNVYVSTAGNQVVKITPSGVSTSLGYVGSSPYGIALDSYGNVYTSNALSDNVSKITPGGVITTIGSTGLSPMALVVDAAGNVYTANSNSDDITKIVQTPTTTTTVAPTTSTTTVPVGLTCPEGFPNRTTGNGTMTLSNGVTLTTTYTGPTLLSGNFNPPFTACGNSFKGNDGAGGTMYLNYTGGAFTLTLTFSQPQSHIAFGIFGMGIYNQPGTTESYTFTTNGGGTQITELNGCGNFQVQGFNTLVGSNNNGTASDGSGAIQVTSSGLFTEVTITGNNSGSLNGVGIDLYLCSNLIIQ